MLSSKPQFERVSANASLLYLLDMYIGNWFTSWSISMSGLCVFWPVNLYFFLFYFINQWLTFFSLSWIFQIQPHVFSAYRFCSVCQCQFPLPGYPESCVFSALQHNNDTITLCMCRWIVQHHMLRFCFALDLNDNSWINAKKLKYVEEEEAWKTGNERNTVMCTSYTFASRRRPRELV